MAEEVEVAAVGTLPSQGSHFHPGKSASPEAAEVEAAEVEGAVLLHATGRPGSQGPGGL